MKLWPEQANDKIGSNAIGVNAIKPTRTNTPIKFTRSKINISSDIFIGIELRRCGADAVCSGELVSRAFGPLI